MHNFVFWNTDLFIFYMKYFFRFKIQFIWTRRCGCANAWSREAIFIGNGQSKKSSFDKRWIGWHSIKYQWKYKRYLHKRSSNSAQVSLFYVFESWNFHMMYLGPLTKTVHFPNFIFSALLDEMMGMNIKSRISKKNFLCTCLAKDIL